MSAHNAPLAVQTGWPLAVACVLAVLVGAFLKPGYLQLLGLVVVEALLLFWFYSVWRLL